MELNLAVGHPEILPDHEVKQPIVVTSMHEMKLTKKLTLNTRLTPWPLLMCAVCLGCSPLQLSPLLVANKASLESRLALARLCESHDDVDRAKKIYLETLEKDPSNTDSLHRLALMAARKGDHKTAQEWFEMAVEQSPDNPLIRSNYGFARYLANDLESAEAQVKVALELDSSFVAAWNNLGLIYGQKEKFDDALAAFQRGSEVESEVLCNMAYVYAQSGRLAEAKERYQAALSLDETNSVAAEGLLQVCAQITGSEPIKLLETFASKVNKTSQWQSKMTERSNSLPELRV